MAVLSIDTDGTLSRWKKGRIMAYDEVLAERIRGSLSDRDGVSERKMFGGIAFMIGGNMACGVVHDDLMVRVGPDAYDAALANEHVRPMDFNHRPMRGMIYVGADGLRTEDDLARWVDAGAGFAASLPAK
jgi:TfoX/Sxy family transcriptional regulator of competence genes